MRRFSLVGLIAALVLFAAPAQANHPARHSPAAGAIESAFVTQRPVSTSLRTPALPSRVPRFVTRAARAGAAPHVANAVAAAAPTHGTFSAWCDSPTAYLYPGWSYGLTSTEWTQVWIRPWWQVVGTGAWHAYAGWYFAWANNSSEYTGRSHRWWVFFPNNPPGSEWQELGFHGSNLWIASPFMGLGIQVKGGMQFFWRDNADAANTAENFVFTSNNQGPDAAADRCVFP